MTFRQDSDRLSILCWEQLVLSPRMRFLTRRRSPQASVRGCQVTGKWPGSHLKWEQRMMWCGTSHLLWGGRCFISYVFPSENVKQKSTILSNGGETFCWNFINNACSFSLLQYEILSAKKKHSELDIPLSTISLLILPFFPREMEKSLVSGSFRPCLIG